MKTRIPGRRTRGDGGNAHTGGWSALPASGHARPGHAVTAVLAAGLALAALVAQALPTSSIAAQEAPRQIRVKVLGMSCPFCAYGVEQKLKRLDGVKDLEVELRSGIATLTLEEGVDVSNERLKKTVEDSGFEAAAIVRSFASDFPDWHPEKLPERSGESRARAGPAPPGP